MDDGQAVIAGTEIPLTKLRKSRITMTNEFEWDAKKAEANYAKHGVSFDVACRVFDDPFELTEEDEFAVGEFRLFAIGAVDAIVLKVVFAEPGGDRIRIISARRASTKDRKIYFDQVR